MAAAGEESGEGPPLDRKRAVVTLGGRIGRSSPRHAALLSAMLMVPSFLAFSISGRSFSSWCVLQKERERFGLKAERSTFHQSLGFVLGTGQFSCSGF
jgi:hypothetical protein